jgi:hypothetical protein
LMFGVLLCRLAPGIPPLAASGHVVLVMRFDQGIPLSNKKLMK